MVDANERSKCYILAQHFTKLIRSAVVSELKNKFDRADFSNIIVFV